ncbi:MAG: lysozyme inhibitor LprI family protein [Campylobacterales bacterium]|nr:lysozyme inhibitor LprI family protein [Campylobacterales bacterium]
MKRLLIPLILSCSLLLASESNAISPSFDCSNEAKLNRVEKLICSDEELSRLDREMNKAYKYMLSTLDEAEKQELINEQRKWLKYRNSVEIDKNYVRQTIATLYSSRLFYLQPDEFYLSYSSDNFTCQTFLNILENDLKNNGDINLSRIDEFNWVKWEKTPKYISTIGKNSFISYFDINNDGTDETIILDEVPWDYKLLELNYFRKEEKNIYNQTLYKLSESLGRVADSTSIGLFDFNEITFAVYSNEKNMNCNTIHFPEPYPVKINNTYYIAVFGLSETFYEIKYPPSLYSMPNNANKIALIKYSPDNFKQGVCILNRANQNTLKHIKMYFRFFGHMQERINLQGEMA